jgi:MOSC domain-containing protein YiiM
VSEFSRAFMTGRIIQINISPGGVPKRPVLEATFTPQGVVGDSWNHPNIHGGPRQAVLILGAESIEELVDRGYPLYPGALGENLTTRGLDRKQLRIGQRLRAGAEVILEITKIRVPCATIEVYGLTIGREIYDKQIKAGDPTSPRWGLSGFYAAVIRPGPVQVNDPIVIESTLA